MRSKTIGAVLITVLASACLTAPAGDQTVASSSQAESSQTTTPSPAPTTGTLAPPATGPVPPPAVPAGPLDPSTSDTLDSLFGSISSNIDRDAIRDLASAGDIRVAWLIADLLRFLLPGSANNDAVATFEALTGAQVSQEAVPWVAATNLLIAWDIPAPLDYVRWKGQLFSTIDQRWAPFFEAESSIDYRLLSWGGVRPDDRPLGDFEATCRGGCIPALDNPGVTGAADGSWYPDARIVFGVSVGGEARAYPKNIMEVHEMVIDTVGGVRIGLPYCTLCGSAQAYELESVPPDLEPPVLRTSGLLVRSNKLMFDLNTWSAIDTFTGVAVSGPLYEAGVELTQLSVLVSTWGDWKATYPDTTIVARDGGIGRTYELDPLGGRDANGPIFPIGTVDPRLPVQAAILGVEAADGSYVAFPTADLREQLSSGGAVGFGDIEVRSDAGGFRAFDGDSELVTHEAFWFAWSQFHPTTGLWQLGLED